MRGSPKEVGRNRPTAPGRMILSVSTEESQSDGGKMVHIVQEGSVIVSQISIARCWHEGLGMSHHRWETQRNS